MLADINLPNLLQCVKKKRNTYNLNPRNSLKQVQRMGLSIEDENLKQLRQRGETLLLWFSPGGIPGKENFRSLALAILVIHQSKPKQMLQTIQHGFPDQFSMLVQIVCFVFLSCYLFYPMIKWMLQNYEQSAVGPKKLTQRLSVCCRMKGTSYKIVHEAGYIRKNFDTYVSYFGQPST